MCVSGGGLDIAADSRIFPVICNLAMYLVHLDIMKLDYVRVRLTQLQNVHLGGDSFSTLQTQNNHFKELNDKNHPFSFFLRSSYLPGRVVSVADDLHSIL